MARKRPRAKEKPIQDAGWIKTAESSKCRTVKSLEEGLWSDVPLLFLLHFLFSCKGS